MSFPLTSDGGAIAQFFRGIEPNDMPVGGTATARAIERARELLARDPTSKDHVRHILLVTDGFIATSGEQGETETGIGKGDSVFIPASTKRYTLRGSGTLYRATPNLG